MKPRSVILRCALAWLAVVPVTAGTLPSPGRASPSAEPAEPPSQAPRPKVPRVIYGTVPDTGQFLPDTVVLAKVNERMIRVRDFVEMFYNSYAVYRPRPDSAGRVQFLNNLVNKEAMAHVALRSGRRETFEDRVVMRQHTQRVLSNVLFQRAVLDSISELTEDESRRVHRQLGYELRLQRIVLRDRGEAERLRRGLQERRIAWKDAVRQSAAPVADSLPPGDLGWVRRGALDPPIALAIFDLDSGTTSAVLAEWEGYSIYRVIGRRDIPFPSYAAARSMIRNELVGMRMDQQRGRMLAVLGVRAAMAHDTANIAWAASRFTPPVSMSRGEIPMIDIDVGVPAFAPQDTSRVLARWRDGRLTLGAFLAAYETISPIMRPALTTTEALLRQVDVVALEPYMAAEALRRGLESDSLAIALIERRREQLLVEHLYQDSILSKVRVPAAERRKYYEQNVGGFTTYPTVTYALFHTSRKSEADSLAARLRAGEKAEAIMRADSLLGIQRGSIEERRQNEEGTPHYRLLFEELRPGHVAVVGDGAHFDAIQSLAFDPGRQLRFEEAEHYVDESLQNLAAEKLLDEFLARHKRTLHIVTRPELVMLIRLTDAPPL